MKAEENAIAPFNDCANLVDQLITALVAVDDDLKVLRVNSAAERLLGKPRSHVVGRPLSKLLPGHPVSVELAERALRLGMPCRVHHATISPSPDKSALVTMTAAPARDDKGVIRGVLLHLEEVGQGERLEEGERLHATLDSMGSLAMTMAHEIKNPLAGIKGAAQLLEMENQSEEASAYTDLICAEVDRVSRLVDDLLGLADAAPLKKEDLNIHEVLDRVALLTGSEENRAIRSYDPSLPDIQGDKDRLIQVFLNLAKNAFDATDGAGRVEITTRISTRVRLEQGRRQLTVVVEVSDDGPGIPEELKKKIFLPFVTTRSEGTGLGLPVAQKIIHDHGGLMDLESQPGQTVFRVFLPVNG